jgi:hypothetical protein
MSHTIGDSCDEVCSNCGVIFCTREIKICPVCGHIPWIYDGGAAKKDFDEWLKKKLEEIQKKQEKPKEV